MLMALTATTPLGAIAKYATAASGREHRGFGACACPVRVLWCPWSAIVAQAWAVKMAWKPARQS
jgi:hypothetical protein